MSTIEAEYNTARTGGTINEEGLRLLAIRNRCTPPELKAFLDLQPTNTATGQFLSELPNLKPSKKSEGKIFDINKLSKKIKSNVSNNFMPERPKNLKIKKRAYRLSRWRRRKLSRV